MRNKLKITMICLGLAAWSGLYADHFVAQNGQTPVWPHTNWTMAASNIQDALIVATNRSVVWVDAGVYRFPTNAIGSNVVYITNALTLRSTSGAAATIIDGESLYRCSVISLASAACAVGPAIIDGFTLTNGFANYDVAGGGRGAGVVLYGAAAGTGIVQNCIVSGNTVQKNADDSYAGGGGIYAYNAVGFVPVISNCLVAGNKTISGSWGASSGGALWFRVNGLIVDCVFANNTSSAAGGAMYFSSPWSVLDRCMVVSNAAATTGGGVYMAAGGCELRNSLVAYNTSPTSGGGVYGYYALRMFNCTVVSNSVGGVRARTTVVAGMVDNCIIDHMVVEAANTVTGYNNCLPSIPNGVWYNTVVTTNNPDYIGFVDWSAGDFRLRRDSPCVNAGINQPDWLAQSRDLDGRARLDRLFRIPDMGCYEYVPRGAIIGLQ